MAECRRVPSGFVAGYAACNGAPAGKAGCRASTCSWWSSGYGPAMEPGWVAGCRFDAGDPFAVEVDRLQWSPAGWPGVAMDCSPSWYMVVVCLQWSPAGVAGCRWGRRQAGTR